MALDTAKVQSFWSRAVDRLSRGREAVIRNCYENTLFWMDQQWIRWDGNENLFVRSNTTKGAPRPVENVYRPKLLKPISMLSAIEPSLTFAPGSEKDDDRITADNARLVVRYIEDIVKIDRVRNRLAYLTVICGNAWTVAGYDPEGGPRVPGTKTFEGELTLDVATPFELMCDYTIPDMERQPVVIWRRMRTIEWLREHYPEAAAQFREGADGNAAASSDLGLTMLQNIIRLQPALVGVVGSSAQYTRSVVIDDVYALPCAEFPNGLLARVMNDGQRVLEAKPLPFHDGTEQDEGRQFIPVTHYGYDEVPGALLCTTPANSMKELQRQRNRLIAHILLYFARSANGVWAVPDGADIQTISGSEGVVIRFNASSAGGGAPQRIEGGRLPNSFGDRIMQVDATMDEMVAMPDLSQQFPRMDSAAMLNSLIEQQQQRLGPVFKRWGYSWVQTATKLFHLFRNFAPDEVYYKIKGEEARWSVKKIKLADLRGGVDIRIESGSLVPKTLLQKRAAYEQMAALQIVDPATDPNVKLKYARAYGATELMEGLAADDDQIAREHDALIQWAHEHFDMLTGELLPGQDPEDPSLTIPVKVDPDCDLHPLHIERHRRFILSEEFQALPLSVQEAFRAQHFRVHKLIDQMQQAEQAQLQSAQQPPGGGKDRSSGEKQSQTKQKKSQEREAA